MCARRRPRSSSSRAASPGRPGRGRSGRRRRDDQSRRRRAPSRFTRLTATAEYWIPERTPAIRLPPKRPPSYWSIDSLPTRKRERRVKRRCVPAVEAGRRRVDGGRSLERRRAPRHLAEDWATVRILDAQVERMPLNHRSRLGRCGGDGTARGTSERPTAVTGDRQGRHRAHDRETRLDSSPSHHQAQHPTGTADRSGPGRRSSAQAPRGRWLRPVPRRPPAGGRGPGAQSTTLRSRRS